MSNNALELSQSVQAALDLEQVGTAVEALIASDAGLVTKYTEEAKNLIVSSPESLAAAADAGKMLKSSQAILEERRDPIVRPHNTFVDVVNGVFKKYSDPAKDALKGLGDRITFYRKEEERKAAEARRKAEEEQRRLEEEARKKQEAENRKAEKKGVEPKVIEAPPPPPPLPPPPPNTTHGRYGKTSGRKDWKWKIVDKKKIPLEYLVPDEKSLNALARAGGNVKIEGIEFYQEETTRF